MDDYLASLRDLDVINETLMDAKTEDVGFNVISRRDSGGKTKKVEMYTSSGIGNFIANFQIYSD